MANKITLRNMEAVLAFLPLFEKNAKLYEIETASITFEPYIYSPEVERFIETIDEEGFLINFSWVEWQDEAKKFIQNPKLTDSADLPTIQKLLTTHVRAERFHSA